jgi:arginine decarboxylase
MHTGTVAVPKAVFLTKGVSKHKYRQQAQELALRHAGIEKFNLVQVLGIIPSQCKIISVKEGIKHLSPGQIVYGMVAESSDNEPNRLLGAGIGVALPIHEQHGYIAKHAGFGITEEKLGDMVEDQAAAMLATTLGIEFDPSRHYDQRKEIYRLSGRSLKTRNIVQTAEGDKHGLWTAVVVAAVFVL